MRPLPLRLRIEAAVHLQPMTVRQLAKCLSAEESSVRHVVGESALMRFGTVKSKGRPWIAYTIAA